ncbi:helix-turn-helix domain-containing protein [Caminicella sporogenes]|uniref:helix-turn-helix domain-containing protein n=1 Tax=Caminicella sporogenes TaxID=166485 RepID=UPI0025414713|nr:helix-turn-helix transcriptional regulator [Caminicella sporogenes]WIF95142.1 helix-turn-helix transcriptional regulator [Caminicella sporogenes]
MSYFDPIVRYQPKIEEVDFIVPERIREACRYRGYTYKEAAKLCGIPERKFGRMANGHTEIPDNYIFNLMKGLGFPKKFFYQIKWERV